MNRSISAQILPAIMFGGLPFYIGAIFWFFPNKMSALFMATGDLWPNLSERIYSPKAMKATGVFWWIGGVVMWSCILFG